MISKFAGFRHAGAIALSLLCSPVLLFAVSSSAHANNTYIVDGGPNGTNSDSCGLWNPDSTLCQPPCKTIKQAASQMASGDVCKIKGGTYRETVTPKSGTKFVPYSPEDDAHPVIISGADIIYGWTPYQSSYTYTYTVPNNTAIYSDLYQDYANPSDQAIANALPPDNNKPFAPQVFVNGMMFRAARYPIPSTSTYDPLHPTYLIADSITPKGGSSYTLYYSSLQGTTGDEWANSYICFLYGDYASWATAKVQSSETDSLTFNVPNNITLPTTGMPFYVIRSVNFLYGSPAYGWMYIPGNDGTTVYVHLQNEAQPCTGVNTSGVNTPPGCTPVEIKTRNYAFDLSDKSDVTIQGINLFATSILTNGYSQPNHIGSSNNIINKIDARYVSYFDSAGWNSNCNLSHTFDTGIILTGSNNRLLNSTIEYSSGNGVFLTTTGSTFDQILSPGNVVENCVIHDVGQAGFFNAGVTITQGNHKVDHNTIYNCGRLGIYGNPWKSGVIGNNIYPTGRMQNTLISYNNIFQTMLLTSDGGGIYINDCDLTGSRIDHNWVHESVSFRGDRNHMLVLASGVYMDDGSSNATIDHNVIWNNEHDAVRLNPHFWSEKINNITYSYTTPSQGHWVVNNTFGINNYEAIATMGYAYFNASSVAALSQCLFQNNLTRKYNYDDNGHYDSDNLLNETTTNDLLNLNNDKFNFNWPRNQDANHDVYETTSYDTTLYDKTLYPTGAPYFNNELNNVYNIVPSTNQKFYQNTYIISKGSSTGLTSRSIYSFKDNNRVNLDISAPHKESSQPDIGAYETGLTRWMPGPRRMAGPTWAQKIQAEGYDGSLKHAEDILTPQVQIIQTKESALPIATVALSNLLPGDWIQFNNIDFNMAGPSGVSQIEFRISIPDNNANRTISIYVDDPFTGAYTQLGNTIPLNPTDTNYPNNPTNFSIGSYAVWNRLIGVSTNEANRLGRHNVRLVFGGDPGVSVGDLDWIQFEGNSSCSDEPSTLSCYD